MESVDKEIVEKSLNRTEMLKYMVTMDNNINKKDIINLYKIS